MCCYSAEFMVCNRLKIGHWPMIYLTDMWLLMMPHVWIAKITKNTKHKKTQKNKSEHCIVISTYVDTTFLCRRLWKVLLSVTKTKVSIEMQYPYMWILHSSATVCERCCCKHFKVFSIVADKWNLCLPHGLQNYTQIWFKKVKKIK